MANMKQSRLDLLNATEELVKELQGNPVALQKVRSAINQPQRDVLVMKKQNQLNYGLMSLLIAFFGKVFH